MESGNFEHRQPPIEAEMRAPRRLLIFGQGPIIDSLQRIKAQDANTEVGTEDMNLWGHTLAEAGAILYKRGVVGEIIVMGGKTGGVASDGMFYQSESEILANELQNNGVDTEAILEEKQSTNTLENLVYLINQYIDTGSSQPGELDVLGTKYHTPRIQLLLELFDVPFTNVFAADEVLRAVAYEENDPKSEALNIIDKRLDMNEASRLAVSAQDERVKVGYFDDKIGTESKSILRRYQEEDAFSRALLETPKYWICYVGKLASTDRLASVLNNVHALFPTLLAEYDIQPENLTTEADYQVVREKLSKIPRDLPNLDEMITEQQTQGWPVATDERLSDFLKARSDRK